MRAVTFPAPPRPQNGRRVTLERAELMDFDLYGLSVPWLVRTCGVPEATARRWKSTGRVPARAVPWLTLMASGNLGAIASPWAGWRLADGELVSPEGERYSIEEVRAIPWRREQLRELEREVTHPAQWSLFDQLKGYRS